MAKNLTRLIFASLFVLQAAQAQQGTAKTDPVDVPHVISEFTAGETKLFDEFSHYGYKLEFVTQSIKDGKVIEEYFRLSEVVLNKDGKLQEKMVKFVRPRFDGIRVTREDLDNLMGEYQFPLRSSEADLYTFVYSGKERLANVDLYLFEVTPKSISSKRRLFHGRVWVGIDSLRIVKLAGKFEQKGEQKYPLVETYRDIVNNQFLFPAGAFGDDELRFDDGSRVHYRLSIRYMDYVKLR